MCKQLENGHVVKKEMGCSKWSEKMYYPKWMEELEKLDTELTKKHRRKEFGFLLEMSGIFMNWAPGYYVLNLMYIGFLVFVLGYHFPCFGMTMAKSNNLAAKGQYMNFMSLVGIAQTTIFCFLRGRKTLTTLFTMSAEGFYNYGLNLNRMEIVKMEKRFAAIKNNLLIALPAWLMLVGASVLGSRYVNQIFQYETPVHDDYVNGVYQNLPLKMWYFYTIDSEFVREVSLFFGGVCALGLALVIGSAMLMMIFFGQALVLQIRTLTIAIRDIDLRADQHYASTSGKKPPKNVIQRRKDGALMMSYQACLRQAMEHHKIIINFFELFQEFIRIPTGISVVNGAILVGMSCITLLQGGGQPNYLVTSCLLIIAEVTTLFIICEIGQTIRDQSEEMFHVMFRVNWSDCSKEVVTNMMIMRIRMAKPLVLCGLSTPLNRATFAMISVNSVMNIFRAFEVVISLRKRSKKARLEALQESG